MKAFLMSLAVGATSLVSPSAWAQDGAALYESCAACHGDQAQGDIDTLAPQLAGQGQVYLREQLINFRDGLRGTQDGDESGQVMAASAEDLSDNEIGVLASYLAALPAVAHTTRLQGDVERGAIFFNDNCADCHGEAAQGISSVYAPNLVVLQDWYFEGQIKAYQVGWRGHEGSTTRAKGMRSFATQFRSAQDRLDVINWLSAIEGKKESQ